MKRFLCALLIVVILLPVVAMAEISWTNMTVEEIQAVIDSARSEIVTREIKTDAKGTVILDADGLVVTITKAEIKQSYDKSYYLTVSYTAVNNSNIKIGFMVDKLYLNGWEVSSLVYCDLDAGMKVRDEFTMYSVDVNADVSSYDDLEELKLVMHTFDADTFMTLSSDIQCTIYFNK